MPKKSEPLFINGRYHFTLSSFDPVKVTLRVPYLTDMELSMGLRSVLEEAGYDCDQPEPPSDAWIAGHMEGFKTYDEVVDAVERRQKEINQSFAEESKQTLCADALAERLEQDIPVGLVQRAYDSLLQGYEEQIAPTGLALSQALAGMGIGEDDFRTMLSNQALTLAKQEAALDAFAEEYAIYADETELPGILGITPAQANEFIKDARKHNDLDELLRHAVRCKALKIVESEAEVTYDHETPEEANDRMDAMMAMREGWTFPDEGDCCGCCGGHGEGECCGGECCGGDCSCDGDDECGCGGGCSCGGDGACDCGHDAHEGAGEDGPAGANSKYPHLKLV